MSSRPTPALAALAAIAVSLLGPAAARAAVIDGQLDAEYGPALVTQTTQTGLAAGQISGDASTGDLSFANGSELDACHAFISGGALHLFLSGNVALVLNANQNGTIAHALDLFIDSVPGGLNPLNGLGSGHPLNGMTFDAGFEPDAWFEYVGEGDRFFTQWRASYTPLTQAGGSLGLLGVGPAGGPGTLTGGSNPHGIRVTIDNRNTAGVPYGCNAASGAGVTTGVEWRIPLAALGNPGDCIRLLAFVRQAGSPGSVSNSVMAPVPPGTCPMGAAAFVNLANIPGDQFVTVCPSAVDVPPGAPAASPRLRLALAGANPARGDGLRFAIELPGEGPARLELFDCRGRLAGGREVGGSGVVDLAAGRDLPPGLYFARLAHAGASVVRRVCVAH